MPKLLPIVVAAMACLVFGVTQAVAQTTQTVYSSLPASGVVSVPSIGAEATSFNQAGNEVILTKGGMLKQVSVTMTDFACQTGTPGAGTCVTTGQATFPLPITLTLYKHSTTNPTTGEVTPGAQITKVTKSFGIRFRPTSTPSCGVGGGFVGSDGLCHNAYDQNVVFAVSVKVPATVVWSVSYNTDTSGPNPIGSPVPQDALNVGLAPKATTGLNRTDDSIFWDTRNGTLSCGSPMGPSDFNRDGPCDGAPNSWAGLVPAAKFTITS